MYTKLGRNKAVHNFLQAAANAIITKAKSLSQLEVANLSFAFCSNKDTTISASSSSSQKPVHPAAKEVIATFIKVRTDWSSPWQAQNLAFLVWSAARSGACSSTTLNKKELSSFLEGVTKNKNQKNISMRFTFFFLKNMF